MDISAKLNLIQEGYSITDINSGSFIKLIGESAYKNEYLIFMESIRNDFAIVESVAFDIINESAFNIFLEKVKKMFAWLRQKYTQMIEFIKKAFEHKQNEYDSIDLKNLKDQFHIFSVRENLTNNLLKDHSQEAQQLLSIATEKVNNFMNPNSNFKSDRDQVETLDLIHNIIKQITHGKVEHFDAGIQISLQLYVLGKVTSKRIDSNDSQFFTNLQKAKDNLIKSKESFLAVLDDISNLLEKINRGIRSTTFDNLSDEQYHEKQIEFHETVKILNVTSAIIYDYQNVFMLGLQEYADIVNTFNSGD